MAILVALGFFVLLAILVAASIWTVTRARPSIEDPTDDVMAVADATRVDWLTELDHPLCMVLYKAHRYDGVCEHDFDLLGRLEAQVHG